MILAIGVLKFYEVANKRFMLVSAITIYQLETITQRMLSLQMYKMLELLLVQ